MIRRKGSMFVIRSHSAVSSKHPFQYRGAAPLFSVTASISILILHSPYLIIYTRGFKSMLEGGNDTMSQIRALYKHVESPVPCSIFRLIFCSF
ncbi:Uncharacterised protein [Bacillus tequilensis]|nr:Uncharacterised protein [Bacillus tequilensis]